MNRLADTLNLTICEKAEEVYVWIWDDAELASAIYSAGRWADDPDLAFDFHDATAVRRKMMETCDV